MGDTIVLDNAMIWAGVPPRAERGWLAIADGRISAMGSADEPRPEAVEVRDLAGRHLLPGFVDAHTHLSVSAWLPQAADGSGWGSRTEVLEAVARHAQSRPRESWVLAMGADFDLWKGGMPDADELELASGARPVLIMDVSLHRGLLSGSGLERLGGQLPRVSGPGDIEYRRGCRTGLLWESASAWALQCALSGLARDSGEYGHEQLLAAEAERHLALGITRAHDPCIPLAVSGAMARLAENTPLKLSWSGVSGDSFMNPGDTLELCPHCGEGPRSAKLFLDGAHKCAMCLSPLHALEMTGGAMVQALKGNLRPVRDLLRYRAVYRRGQVWLPYLRMEQQTLNDRLAGLASDGVRPKIHALGNHATECACRGLRVAGIRNATLEHLTLLGEKELDAVADCGAVASIQPGFLGHFGETFLDTRVVPRLRCLPAASLQRRGVPLALSSDNPCGPLDPLTNIGMAVSRRTPDGRVVSADEAITLEDAVAAYSSGGYHAIHGEPGPGLAVDAPADLAILSDHPSQAFARVVQTWVDGVAVWEDGDSGRNP